MANFYASFGSKKTGLATVGYVQMNGSTVVVARATAGIVETGGGVYMVPVVLDAATTSILWDTGEGGNTIFAVEDVKVNRIHELLDVIEGTLDHQEVMRLLLASAANKLSGAEGLNVKIRDLADTKDRIDATVDANGNRTAVIVDAS